MSDKPSFAVLPAADGQPTVTTQYSAAYQAAVDGAVSIAEQWLTAPSEQSLPELLNQWTEWMPGSARAPFHEAFLMRLQQRLRAYSLASQAQVYEPSKDLKEVNLPFSNQPLEGQNDE